MSVRATSRARPFVLAVAALALAAACLPAQVARGGPTASASAPAALVPATPASTPGVSGGDAAGASPALSPSPSAPPTLTPAPTATPVPTATPRPMPSRGPVTVNLVSDPAAHFVTEVQKTWCAASATQMVLAIDGKVDLRTTTQAAIRKTASKFWTWADSHTPGWGPEMMAKTLAAYGVPGYQVRTYRTRAAALLDAAKAVERLHQPVLLLVWWGAHTWVMTGFRATADPLAYTDATVTGTYILDPWYPRISSIWGPSDPPGTFQNAKEMVRNYIAWTRPEGLYPGRDGRWLAVVPTLPAP
jgi:hypothetical protein